MCCKEMLLGELIQNEVVFAYCSLVECVKGGWGEYVPCMHLMLIMNHYCYEIITYNYVLLKDSNFFLVIGFFPYTTPKFIIFLFDLILGQPNFMFMICMDRNHILKTSIKDSKLWAKLGTKPKIKMKTI
jgi:hypothetical protein